MPAINTVFQLLAEDATPPPVSPLMQFMPFILIFVIFYFVLIRPQKKRQAKMREQMESLKSGDKVITAGGIHGLVTNVKEKSVTLKVADNVKIEFEKASITTVIKKDGDGSTLEPAPSGEPLPNNG